MKLVTLIALLGGVEALTKWTDQIYDSTMGCAQCIATGNWFCKERGWYQTINASTGTVNQKCCPGYADACSGSNEQNAASYLCSRASYGSPARTGFADENLAIHACPSDSRICGTDKYIEFKKDGSTGTSKTIRISTGLLGTNSCTYLVKSECSAVTMTQGPNWNWSAPGTNYKIIVSEWAEKEITKNAATSSEYVVSSENVYTAWPVKGTTTVSVDDQTPFYSTEYGYRKQVIAAATSSAPLQPEKFRLIVGGEVIDQMANKKAEIYAYNKLLLNFKNLSAEWTQFLKIEKSIVDMSAFNFLVAKKDQGRVWKGFSRPDPPFEPATYLGPSYKNTTPYFGWGKPSSYEYAPDSPGTQSGKYVQRFKNFGRMGYSSTSGLATVENQKDGTCTASFMAVTIIPKVGYTQSGTEVVELVFGSEPYASVDYSDIPTIEKAVPAQSRTDWTAIFP